MFEVIRTSLPYERGFFRKKRYVAVTFRATQNMWCAFLDRTFQGHGNWTTQTYRVDIAEGDVHTLSIQGSPLRVGDKRALETLVGEGYFREYARLVATT